jgi:hypothetical protein
MKVSEGGGGGIAAAVAKQQQETRLRIQARSASATEAERAECKRILDKAKAVIKKESEEVVMTPALAALLFAQSKMHNREWYAAKSAKLARVMDAGEFQDNGDTVRFYVGGDFADAQHRVGGLALTAVENAEKMTFQWTFVYGIAKTALATIDTDRSSRTAADTLKLESISDAKAKEAVLKAAAVYLGKLGSYEEIPHATTTQVVESCRVHNAELTRALEVADASVKGISEPILKRNQAATVALICILVSWPEDVLRKYLYRIQTGVTPEGESDKNPLFLASDLINTMRDRAKGKESLRTQGEIAVVLKGLVLAAQGVTATRTQSLKAAAKEMPDPSFPLQTAEAAE